VPHHECWAAVVPDEFALVRIDSDPAMAERIQAFLQEELGEPPLTVTSGCISKKSSRKKLLTGG
jgi:hypothetical protein